MTMSGEIWFHAIEILVMLMGVALPVSWAAFRLIMLFRDFPPHLHLNGKIVYPKGYGPPEVLAVLKPLTPRRRKDDK